MNRIERSADERMAAFQGRLDLLSAILPRSDEFIRSGVVKVIDIEVRVRAKTQRSAKHAKNRPEVLPQFSLDLSLAHRNRYGEDPSAAD